MEENIVRGLQQEEFSERPSDRPSRIFIQYKCISFHLTDNPR